jgi:GT2 family glycosyltransferase
MTNVSVVIPAFNAAETIAATIANVLGQGPEVLEVIVVDDGSTDGTPQIVDALIGATSRLRLVRCARDKKSCRSRARNRGARVARGAQILFLDSAWRLEPGLLEAAHALLDGKTALLVPFGRGGAGNENAVDSPLIVDERWGYFAANQGNLQRLACPWLLGWSGAMFVPRELFERVEGFDEEFLGWGAEDLDFAMRLHQAGAGFHALLSHCAFRAYGLAPTGPERLEQLGRNIARIQAKNPCMETEILNAIGQTHATSLVERLEVLPLQHVVQEPDEEGISALRGYLHQGPTLLSGATPAFARALEVSHVLAHNSASYQELRRMFPQRTVKRSLGVLSPFPTVHFEAAFATDLLRVVTPHLQVPMLRELRKGARRAFVICSIRESALSVSVRRASFREAAGFELCSLEALAASARLAGARLSPACQTRHNVVFELNSPAT